MLTRAQATAIATAVHQVRPEWDHAGVLAAVTAAQHLGSPTAILQAAAALAANQGIRTPGALRLPGAHWAGTPVAERRPPTMCADHPEHRAADCPRCAATLRDVDHAARARHLRAVLAAAPRYTDPHTAAAQRGQS